MLLQNADLNSPNIYKSSLLKNIQLKDNFANLLRLNKIYHSHLDTSISDNNTSINTGLFFSTEKIIYYKKNFKKRKRFEKSLKFKKKSFKNTLRKKLTLNLKQKTFLTKNLHLISDVWNGSLDNIYATKIYNALKKYNSSLFSQKSFLFADLIKIVTLVSNNKKCFLIFVKFLGFFFSKLPKRKHNLCISFLKLLLNLMIFKYKENILGMKIIINGKLQGKTRAKTTKIKVGSVASNTIENQSLFSKVSIYNLYGAFGIQVLINYAPQN